MCLSRYMQACLPYVSKFRLCNPFRGERDLYLYAVGQMDSKKCRQHAGHFNQPPQGLSTMLG